MKRRYPVGAHKGGQPQRQPRLTLGGAFGLALDNAIAEHFGNQQEILWHQLLSCIIRTACKHFALGIVAVGFRGDESAAYIVLPEMSPEERKALVLAAGNSIIAASEKEGA